ncbi:MAG: glycosyltransferase [Sphingobacteriales bacterium]|nr:glycosyltransferase [Sphingobacteriales bacterium]
MTDNNLQHNNPALVSVVMCTYNGEKFLHQQIGSVLSQTYSNIELLIVDDASSDNTILILEEYKRKDSRVKYFMNERNLGYNKNFEKGFSLANGEYIAPCDQDDIWSANKIEIMMKEWPEGSLFVYSLSGSFIGDDFENRTDAPKVYYSTIDDVHKLVFNSPVHGHACMFKKELIAGCLPFPADIFYDWWISMHAASTGVIGCIPHTLTWHRVHERNFSRDITSIRNKEEREQQLRNQCAYFLETFFQRPVAREKEKQSLLHYASLLRQMDGKNFSKPMFKYVMQYRKLIFHYKKKPFVFFSHYKYVRKMARKGLL